MTKLFSKYSSTATKAEVILIAALIFLFVVIAPSVYADDENGDQNFDGGIGDEYGVSTRIFDTNAVVDENHVIHITETIVVNFSEPRHGITRFIPYEEKYYRIENFRVRNNKMTTKTDYAPSKDGAKIKTLTAYIGDEDVLFKGEHKYVINYDLVCFKDDSTKKDYFSLDLLPAAWEMPIGKAKMSLTMPKSIDWSKIKLYAGAYGSTSGLPNNFTVEKPRDIGGGKTQLKITGKNIPANYSVTLLTDLPEGYWVNPANRDYMISIIFILIIGTALLIFILWLLFGRDMTIVRTVEFRPPDAMTPAEVGYVIDGSVDDEDISSLIMYFAHKGYLAVEEREREKFRLVKLADIDDNEPEFCKTMFSGLFGNGVTEFDMDDIPDDFFEVTSDVRHQIVNRYSCKERRLFTVASNVMRYVCRAVLVLLPVILIMAACAYVFEGITDQILILGITVAAGAIGNYMTFRAFDRWDSMPRGKAIFMIIVGILLIVAVSVISGFFAWQRTGKLLIFILLQVSMVLSLFFTIFMRARTKQSVEWLGKLLGFRDFIRDAEYEKLKLMSDEDPQYFYDIMPYAYVLGMSTKWAKKFESINVPPPNWYRGDSMTDTVFTLWWYSAMMRSCTASMASSINQNRVRTVGSIVGGIASTGFSGGSFSGGGFGGGGGGSW